MCAVRKHKFKYSPRNNVELRFCFKYIHLSLKDLSQTEENNTANFTFQTNRHDKQLIYNIIINRLN